MDNPESKSVSSGLALPVPAIICISIGAYIVVVIIILIIRQVLMQRGICASGQCCGKEGEPCCECCIACSEAFNCCRSPNIEACLDSCCPARRKMDAADIIMCQCCNEGCCGQKEPMCDCGQCNCNCQCGECDNFNCLCFTIQSKPLPEDYDDD